MPPLWNAIQPPRKERDRVYELSIYYDSANICKSWENLSFNSSFLVQSIQGFIPRTILEDMPNLALLPFDALRDLPFWTRGQTLISRNQYEITDRTLERFNNDYPPLWR